MTAIRKTIEPSNNAADAGHSTLNSAAESAQRLTDQFTQAFILTGGRDKDLTQQASQNLEAITGASSVLARGVQDLSREWFSLMQEQLQKNLDGFSALARCRSFPDYVELQRLVGANLQQTLDGTRRIAKVSTRLAYETTQAVKAETTGAAHGTA
jgi:hypothetical protein